MAFNTLHRKDRLILTTIDIINELGINGLTTKEIARRQGVSEGTIFKHYRNKNELIIATLDHFTQYDSDIFYSAQLRKLGPREAITFYIDSYASYYENYPAITAITQAYDVLRYDPELEDKVKQIYRSRADHMKQMIESAQEANVISKEENSEDLADIISSTCNGICLKWRMNGYNFSLREKTLVAVNMLLDAFKVS
ncbi:MAG: TetR/AcrR family transcriptional regulator [Bacillota bacterium]|nr:TetR/AcrR family transcriptional regulator [Bacillota bacterium]